MLKLVFLTEAFYAAYRDCSELEQKGTRPYAQIQIKINGVLWGIPLRSHIRHSHAIWTDKENGCGLDLTKAVVITDPVNYISPVVPHIREGEFAVLKRISEYEVVQKLCKYIKVYKKAKAHTEVKRNRDIVSYSTLQYFEQYI